MMHDLLQPTDIALRRSSRVAHLYARLGRATKAWVNSQDLLPFAWFLLVDFPEASRDRDRRRDWPRTERRQKVSDAKSKKSSGWRFKTQSVGLVEAETFFCLALIIYLYSACSQSSSRWQRKVACHGRTDYRSCHLSKEHFRGYLELSRTRRMALMPIII